MAGLPNIFPQPGQSQSSNMGNGGSFVPPSQYTGQLPWYANNLGPTGLINTQGTGYFSGNGPPQGWGGPIPSSNPNQLTGVNAITGSYPAGTGFQQINDSGGFGGFLDNLIKYGSMAGTAAIGGAAALGYGAPAAGAATGGNILDYGAVPGSWGGAGGAQFAGDVGAGMGSALPGSAAAGAAPATSAGALSGIGDVATGTAGAGGVGGASSLFGAPATTSGLSGPLAGLGGGPLDALNVGTGGVLGTDATSGISGAAGIGANATGGGLPSWLGNNPLGNISNLAGNLTNIFKNPGGALQGPYNTAMGNANPAIQNLLSMMNPNNFYNSTIGQNLQAAKVRDINATQSAAGRFGLQPGGTIPSSGAGIDAANLLNQYMAQQWASALNASSGAVNPLLGNVNATLPGYYAGNVIGANNLNPLTSLFQNPIIDQGGNSALNYIWNGLG